MNNIHYVPQHPLPQEIQDLPVDDTICKYCGVSYLIHNEIKKLEEKLEEYKNEVERLQHFDEREKALKEEIQQLKLSTENVLEKWKNAKDECSKTTNLINEKEEQIESLNKKNLSLQTQKTSLAGNMRYITAEIITFKFIIEETKKMVTMILKDQEYFLKNSCQSINSSVKAKTGKLEMLVKNKDIVLAEAKGNLRMVSAGYDKKIIEIENKHTEELEKKLLDAGIEKKKLLDNQRKLFIEKQQKLEVYHNQEKENLVKKLQDLKEELLSEEKKKSAAIDEWKIQLDIVSKENLKLTTDIKTLKANENSDKQDLLSQVKNLEAELNSEKVERENLIQTHQNRIEELREHFKKKLLEAEKLPLKVEEASLEVLRKQKEEHIYEIQTLKEEFQENFVKFEKEQEKRWRQKLSEEATKYESKETKLKNILSNLQQKLETEVKQYQDALQNEKNDRIADVTKYSELTEQLKRELKNKEMKNVDVTSMNKLEEEILILNETISHKHDEINGKQKEIIQLKDEVTMLRDCVRKECEERYELTESLSQARTELLALQRFNSPPTVSNKKKLPTPPILSSLNSSHGSTDQTTTIKKTSLSLSSHRNSPQDGAVKKTDQQQVFEKAVGRHTKNKLKISLKNVRT